MILLDLLGLVPAFLGLFTQPPPEQQVVRRMVVRDEIVLRIPVRPRMSPIEWLEHKGPKCVDAEQIAGAMLSGPSSIDFVLRNRQRIRAKMDSECPALDFYGGFYLQPEDDRICAKREEIRSRVGGSCQIDRFRRLTPRVKH